MQVEGDVRASVVRAQLDRALGINAKVEILRPGSIPRSEGKALRIRDLR